MRIGVGQHGKRDSKIKLCPLLGAVRGNQVYGDPPPGKIETAGDECRLDSLTRLGDLARGEADQVELRNFERRLDFDFDAFRARGTKYR